MKLDWPKRNRDAHKGDFGRVFLVGGSRGMTGAVTLAAMACLRSGAGLLTVGVPNSLQAIVASSHPSMMTVGLPEIPGASLGLAAGKMLQAWAARSDAIAFGPGCGRHMAIDRLAANIFQNSPCPAVLDADGLNGLAASLPGLRQKVNARTTSPRVLTPHPGEFQRLWLGAQTAGLVPRQVAATTDDREAMEEQAMTLARALECVVLLKGPRTLVTDGRTVHHNETGNPGLATGGSGDCLTGVIAALLPVLPDPLEAAALAAHVHGLAGDLAAESLGETAMTSLDLLEYLPRAWQKL